MLCICATIERLAPNGAAPVGSQSAGASNSHTQKYTHQPSNTCLGREGKVSLISLSSGLCAWLTEIEWVNTEGLKRSASLVRQWRRVRVSSSTGTLAAVARRSQSSLKTNSGQKPNHANLPSLNIYTRLRGSRSWTGLTGNWDTSEVKFEI